MNERIKELAKNCYETGPLGKDGWPQFMKFNEEKFAQLIVRECADICYNRDYTDGSTYGDAIHKHFGVEE